MNKKTFNVLALIAGGVLIAGMMSSVTTHATVPGENEAIDMTTSGGTPTAGGSSPDMSHDGRYVAFRSNATDLVTPTTNGQTQIYVKDRLNNTITLVSVSSSGVQGNSYSVDPQISASGRFVVFVSNASNLVSGDTNATSDTFMHDLLTHTTQRVSTSSTGAQADYGGSVADVSSDGQYVVFTSYSSNLVTSPVRTYSQTYLKNMKTGEVKMVSQSPSGVAANSTQAHPRISCEGRFITYQSAANNLVSGDVDNPTQSKQRIYIVDMLKPIAPIYIKSDPDASMSAPGISCSGNHIAFVSPATNIITGDTNGFVDVFVYDRINATFERVSISTSGTESNANIDGSVPQISSDGKLVSFFTEATNLVSGDTNSASDVFLRNRQAGTTELVSRDINGTVGNGASWSQAMSLDGRYLSYYSRSTNLVSGFGNSTTGMLYSSQTGLSSEY